MLYMCCVLYGPNTWVTANLRRVGLALAGKGGFAGGAVPRDALGREGGEAKTGKMVLRRRCAGGTMKQARRRAQWASGRGRGSDGSRGRAPDG